VCSYEKGGQNISNWLYVTEVRPSKLPRIIGMNNCYSWKVFRRTLFLVRLYRITKSQNENYFITYVNWTVVSSILEWKVLQTCQRTNAKEGSSVSRPAICLIVIYYGHLICNGRIKVSISVLRDHLPLVNTPAKCRPRKKKPIVYRMKNRHHDIVNC